MRNTFLAGLAGMTAGVAATALLVNFGQVEASSETYRQLNLFGDVFERVRSDYVEKPDDSKLVESAISGMLTGLDPHSAFLDADAYKEMQTTTTGRSGQRYWVPLTRMGALLVCCMGYFLFGVDEREGRPGSARRPCGRRVGLLAASPDGRLRVRVAVLARPRSACGGAATIASRS